MDIRSGGRAEIANVANRWKRHYFKNKDWFDHRKEEIWQALEALDIRTATAADIARIIGNDSWVGYLCEECGDRVSSAIVLGDEDTDSFTVCGPCLNKAVQLLGVVHSNP